MRRLVLGFLRDDRGATAIEYAVMASLIALAIVGSVSLLSTNVKATYNNIANGVIGAS